MAAYRRCLIALLAVLAMVYLCLNLPGQPAQKAPSDPTVVPFEMLPSNHMVVEVKINDKGPYWLVFDLGAPITLLSNKAGEATGVVDANTPRSFLFSMRGEATIKKLKVADLTAEGLPVIVLEHPALKVLSEIFGRPIDGIIGYTFFAHYKTTIDYQARKMTFKPVEFDVRNLMRDLPDRLIGPKVQKHRVLNPGGLWGVTVGAPPDDPSAAGVPILTVLAGSAAAAAGLKPGDILKTVDGRWTTSVTDTYAAAAAVAAGRPVSVVILRDGKELSLTVTPADGI